MTRLAGQTPTLPAWPALMATDLACAYLSLGEASFRFLARTQKVDPVECAGLALVRWRKTDLDRLIDSLPARGAEMAPDSAPPVDPAQTALERANRRAAR